jgi:hypothetical protein
MNPYASPSETSPKASPVVRRISWPAFALQMAMLITVLMAAKYVAPGADAVLWIVGGFLVLTLALRFLVPRAHRRGIRYVRSGQYEPARECFLESYAFFTRHAWIDRYRAITLMSASYMSYREMALCNAAFCCTQIGEGQQARQLYQQALEEFPHSGMAATALNVLSSVEKGRDDRS